MFIDTDGDGMPDGWEVLHGFNTNINDAMIDSDGDFVLNIHEFEADTNPRTNTSFLGISGIDFYDGQVHLNWHGGTAAVQYVEWTYLGSTNWYLIDLYGPPMTVDHQLSQPWPMSEPVIFRLRAGRP